MESISNLNNFLFIGDSFTHILEDTIKSNNDKVYIFAQGGSRPSYWIDKIDDMPDSKSVVAIILLIGINGILEESNIRDGKILIDKLSKKYPEKEIFVQKVFPVGQNFSENNKDVILRNKAIEKYNKEIKLFCENQENINVIDTTHNFVDDKGFLKFTSDGLHIDLDYNKYFYDNIFNAIKKS